MKRTRLAILICRAFVLFTNIAISLLAASAQQSSDQLSKFRSQVDLVVVPVQVRAHGQHVADLKQDAFTLMQDGKPQKITTFEEVRTTTQRLRRAPVGPRQFTNTLLSSPGTARYTVIAIDRLNTEAMDLIRVRDGLTRFLADAGDTGEPIRLVSIETNGIHLLQDFTTDPKVIAAGLERLSEAVGKPGQSGGIIYDLLQEAESREDPQGDYVSAGQVVQYIQGLDTAQKNQERVLAFQERQRRINSLEALQEIALSLRGLPGRKSLVWASSGYPFTSTVRRGHSRIDYDFSQVSEATRLDVYTTQLLNSANIAMYPVDARGLVNPAWDAMDPTHKYSPSYAEKETRQQANQDVITTFERLAAGTGGRPCYNRPELQDCFKEALDDSRDYYMVGFYVDRKETKDGWHKLEVRVNENGVNVRARNGFMFPLSAPTELDLNTSVQSTLIETGIPIVGEWTGRYPKDGKLVSSFVLRIPPEAVVLDAQQRKLSLEVVVVARGKNGTVAAQIAQRVEPMLTPETIAMIQESGISYKNSLDLVGGEYLVRIVVRDTLTGRTGAVNSMVKVE